MTQNCPKLKKYLFLGISWCIFATATGLPVNPHARGFRICMARGVGSKKCLVLGNFQSVPRYRKRTDQKPPILKK